MPVAVSYPGVYVEEISSGVRTITGVATSITAFVGRTHRGTTDEPTRVQSFGEFERAFGGLWSESTVSYAVAQFFQNGGGDALIVRVANSAAAPSTASVKSIKAGSPAAAGTGALPLAAASGGTWGDSLWAHVEPVPGDATNTLVNLTVLDNGSGTSEQFLNLSTDPTKPAFRDAGSRAELGSGTRRRGRPGDAGGRGGRRRSDEAAHPRSRPVREIRWRKRRKRHHRCGHLGARPRSRKKKGIWALEKADLFNLLCIPPLKADTDIGLQTRDAAATYCKKRRALFIVDPPIAWDAHTDAISGVVRPHGAHVVRRPLLPVRPGTRSGVERADRRLRPVRRGRRHLRPHRRDARRLEGAGRHSRRRSAASPGSTVKLTDGENGELNPLGRQLPAHVPDLSARSSGARARSTAPTSSASEWKYVPVRRTRAVHRGEPVSAARSGSSSSRTTSRCGRRSG